MIPPIYIDTRSLSMEFDITKEDVENMKERVVQTVTKVVHSSWVLQAKRSLQSTRGQYINSLVVSASGRFENTITLVGELPNMIESGKNPFDMKKGFESSSKRIITRDKDGKLGWYLTIPFTWAQSGSLGESQKFSGVLPSDISGLLRKKSSSGDSSPLSLSDIPDEFKIPKTRKRASVNNMLIPEYKNKNSLYEGLSQKSKGGPVTSFRRVSSNSDESSWIHTGIKAYNLSERAIVDAKVPEVVGDVIDSYLDDIL